MCSRKMLTNVDDFYFQCTNITIFVIFLLYNILYPYLYALYYEFLCTCVQCSYVIQMFLFYFEVFSFFHSVFVC